MTTSWSGPCNEPGSPRGIVRAIAPALACVLVLWSQTAAAFVVEGVDFSDFLLFQLPASGDLTLSTSQDVYVFAPDAIVANVLDLTAAGEIFVSQSVTADTISFCAQMPVCATGPYTYDRDVVVALSGPVGSLTLLAGGAIVVAADAVPEPASGLLLALGLLGIGSRRTRRRGR